VNKDRSDERGQHEGHKESFHFASPVPGLDFITWKPKAGLRGLDRRTARFISTAASEYGLLGANFHSRGERAVHMRVIRVIACSMLSRIPISSRYRDGSAVPRLSSQALRKRALIG
jgi:hypothetical protein